MKESHSRNPFFDAASITHALKEYGPDKTMLGGIRRIARENHDAGYQEGYRDGTQHGIVSTLLSLLSNQSTRKR